MAQSSVPTTQVPEVEQELVLELELVLVLAMMMVMVEMKERKGTACCVWCVCPFSLRFIHPAHPRTPANSDGAVAEVDLPPNMLVITTISGRSLLAKDKSGARYGVTCVQRRWVGLGWVRGEDSTDLLSVRCSVIHTVC